MSIEVASFEITPFSLFSIFTSQGEDDDLLVYTVSLPVPTLASTPIFTALAPVPIKPPITQVYSRSQDPLVSSPTSAALSSDPVRNNDLLIALRKGKRQCAHPISSFVSYNHLLSSSCSFIASLDSISLSNIVLEGFISPWLA